MKKLFKNVDLRIAVLTITLLLSYFPNLHSEVRLFEKPCAENKQGDKWFFAEDNGLYGVYLNDKCVIPIEYKNIRFEIPYFFVEDTEYKEGVYNGEGKIVIPIERGELTMREDFGGLIIRQPISEDKTLYNGNLMPAFKTKEYIYGAYPEIFKSDQSGTNLGAMKDVAKKRIIPTEYGIDNETGEIIPITSKSYGLQIDYVKLLDKDGLPISNRDLDNITIALLDNDLSFWNNGFTFNIIKNYDRTKNPIPWKSKIPTMGFCSFTECEFIYGYRNNFPYFKIVDLTDGFTFTFEKNLITLEYQDEKLKFIPSEIDSESLKTAIEEANNGNYEPLLTESIKEIDNSWWGISSLSRNSSMYFEFLWEEFINNALECNWKKIRMDSTTPSFGLAYFK